jgi:hypothetical protein
MQANSQRTSQLKRRSLAAYPRRAQRGYLMLEATLALILATAAAFFAFEAKNRADDADAARLQGDAVLALRSAAHKLVMENYANYQKGLSVSHKRSSDGVVVTLAAGTGAGQSMRPTVATFRGLNLGVDEALDNGTYKALASASYDFLISRTNQCSVNTADEACQVTGFVCLNKPVRRFSDASGAADSVAEGIILTRLGGYGAASFIGSNAAQIISADGAWRATNPYGSVPGIICAKFGWGSESDDYLRRFDTRDPMFQGDLTAKGNITSTDGYIGAGKGTDSAGQSCSLGAILNSGQIVSRAANCVRRAWLDGSTGQIGAADANGTTRLLIDGNTGGLSSKDAAGNDRAGIRYNSAGESELYADNLLNNAGTAGIKSDGTVFGKFGKFDNVTMGAATLNAAATLGASCSPDGGMSWALLGNRFTLARCTGGVWVATGGFLNGTSGTACAAVDGTPGIGPSGEQLLCQAGTWVRTLDRMGRTVLMGSFLASDGASISKPSCLPGSTGTAAYMAMGSEQQANQYANRFLSDNGNSWSVNMKNGMGATIPGDVVVITYCTY